MCSLGTCCSLGHQHWMPGAPAPAPGCHPGSGPQGLTKVPDVPSPVGEPVTSQVRCPPSSRAHPKRNPDLLGSLGVPGPTTPLSPVCDRAFPDGRVRHPPRSFTPRIPAGPRVSSPPPRPWAGVPPSWCKCHRHWRAGKDGRVLLSLWGGDGVAGGCSSPSLSLPQRCCRPGGARQGDVRGADGLFPGDRGQHRPAGRSLQGRSRCPGGSCSACSSACCPRTGFCTLCACK